jgi:hypothetical protein
VSAKKTRGTPADAQTRAEVAATVQRLGWTRAVEILGISQHAIERILAGADVLRSTTIAARVGMAAMKGQQP